jgi:hypothetical protein
MLHTSGDVLYQTEGRTPLDMLDNPLTVSPSVPRGWKETPVITVCWKQFSESTQQSDCFKNYKNFVLKQLSLSLVEVFTHVRVSSDNRKGNETKQIFHYVLNIIFYRWSR